MSVVQIQGLPVPLKDSPVHGCNPICCANKV
uniref:Uncharacterized protein n=1 Tax=Rhizophora mucronata TaxID=61149 RepID=A0A2P2P0F1_RHIMU